MKILFAYDGSDCSKYALEDFQQAGLPDEGVDVRVLSVAEYIFPSNSVLATDPEAPITSFTSQSIGEMNQNAFGYAKGLAEEACRTIRKYFPKWNVQAWARLSSPATTIIELATDWQPDLIVMGSHGRSALGRFFIGSVSMRVATEAPCSVRIVKHNSAKRPPLILVAYDGSDGSRSAVDALTRRSWAKGTALHIVTIADTSLLGSLEYVSLVDSDQYQVQNDGETRVEHLMHSIEVEMKKYFDSVTSTLVVGSATQEIVREAERVNASAIFLGSHGYAKMERLLLGSVSYGVAAHSKATIEIVR